MNLSIREFNALDLNNGFLETLSSLAEVGLTPDEAREVYRSHLRAGAHTYVALADQRVVGTVTLLLEQKFIHHGGRIGHIEDVAVHREYQHHGIASALVRHATEVARQEGCYKVILSCFEPLCPFYERLGFHRHDVGMRVDL